MFSMPQNILEATTEIFQLERNHKIVGTVRGFFASKRFPNTIQIVEDVEILPDDWLIYRSQRYHVIDAHPARLEGTVDWIVSYETESNHSRPNESSPGSIHIETVSGPAIIGNQQNATLNVGSNIEDIAKLISSLPSGDMEELLPLLTKLREVEESGAPLKKGCLSKFSDALQKHSNILIALGGWAVKLLTGE